MKQIKVEDIKLKVKDALIKANQVIDCEILNALNKALIEEDSKLAKEVLATIIQNDELAKEKGLPICQDTGLVVAFVKLGYQISLDGNLVDVINEGVKEAYLEGALRKSVVLDPFNRVNTLDNTPAIIHIEMDNSDQLTIDLCPKGAGSENMSTIKMFPPSAGLDGVKEFIINFVKQSAPKACAPVIVGIGIGGNFEQCAINAKKAIVRPLNEEHNDPFYKSLEQELKTSINESGIGPMGFGGKTTCLAVKIIAAPCHIASLPVAINIQCHVSRHQRITF